MKRTTNEVDARRIASECEESYGWSPHNKAFYIGTPEALRKMGVSDIRSEFLAKGITERATEGLALIRRDAQALTERAAKVAETFVDGAEAVAAKARDDYRATAWGEAAARELTGGEEICTVTPSTMGQLRKDYQRMIGGNDAAALHCLERIADTFEHAKGEAEAAVNSSRVRDARERMRSASSAAEQLLRMVSRAGFSTACIYSAPCWPRDLLEDLKGPVDSASRAINRSHSLARTAERDAAEAEHAALTARRLIRQNAPGLMELAAARRGAWEREMILDGCTCSAYNVAMGEAREAGDDLERFVCAGAITHGRPTDREWLDSFRPERSRKIAHARALTRLG